MVIYIKSVKKKRRFRKVCSSLCFGLSVLCIVVLFMAQVLLVGGVSKLTFTLLLLETGLTTLGYYCMVFGVRLRKFAQIGDINVLFLSVGLSVLISLVLFSLVLAKFCNLLVCLGSHLAWLA